MVLGCLAWVFGRCSYPPGPILESAFLWTCFCRQNLPVCKIFTMRALLGARQLAHLIEGLRPRWGARPFTCNRQVFFVTTKCSWERKLFASPSMKLMSTRHVRRAFGDNAIDVCDVVHYIRHEFDLANSNRLRSIICNFCSA